MSSIIFLRQGLLLDVGGTHQLGRLGPAWDPPVSAPGSVGLIDWSPPSLDFTWVLVLM